MVSQGLSALLLLLLLLLLHIPYHQPWSHSRSSSKAAQQTSQVVIEDSCNLTTTKKTKEKHKQTTHTEL
jgi:hypothetical protein